MIKKRILDPGWNSKLCEEVIISLYTKMIKLSYLRSLNIFCLAGDPWILHQSLKTFEFREVATQKLTRLCNIESLALARTHFAIIIICSSFRLSPSFIINAFLLYYSLSSYVLLLYRAYLLEDHPPVISYCIL